MSRTPSPAIGAARKASVVMKLEAAPPPPPREPPLVFNRLRSFVRVRPFTEPEAKHVPEGQVVARPILGRAVTTDPPSLVVFDPVNKFRPKKGGSFPLDNVLWSFFDDGEPDALRHLQPEVYEAVVAPVVPSICAGYSALFAVFGAAESGKWSTFYGDDAAMGTAAPPATSTSAAATAAAPPPAAAAPGPASSKGLVHRFAAEIMGHLQRAAPEATLAVEYEAIEIVNEQYVDLVALGSSARRTSLSKEQPGSPAVADLRVVADADGCLRLTGVTRVVASNGAALEAGIRAALKPMKRRKNTHCVTLRFTETHEFQDPERPTGAKISKSRRINVSFAFLRNVPHSFHRCFDVAIERDSGDNAQSIVPTRECAFTRLFADVFAQQYLTSVVSCVSPFCEHTKDAMGTLAFANRIKKIKTGARILQDERMSEMRTLANEVKGLHCEVARINESMLVVQQELDRRQDEIQRQEDIHAEQTLALEDGASAAETAKLIHVVKSFRLACRKRQAQTRVEENTQALAQTRAAASRHRDAAATLDIACRAEETTHQTLQAAVASSDGRAAPLQARIDARAANERLVSDMEAYNQAAPEDRQAQVKDLFATRDALQRLIPQLEGEKKAARGDLGEAKIKHDEVRPAYDALLAQEAEAKKMRELREQLAQVERDTAALQGESKRLQDEIDNAPKPGCCAVM